MVVPGAKLGHHGDTITCFGCLVSPPMDMICITHGRVHGEDNDNPAVFSGITVYKDGSLTVKPRNVHPVGT